MDIHTVLKNLRDISSRFAAERTERQQRRALVTADFAELRDAGFLLTGVPVEEGGVWQDLRRSTRPVCETLRILAHGDPSVALVCAMHPSVLAVWLTSPEVPAPYQEAWVAQRSEIFQTVREGAWWGTITSEPGSGGDMAKTKATARPAGSDGRYLITGQKQFGSGSGITSYMITDGPPGGRDNPRLVLSRHAGCALGRHSGGDSNSTLGWSWNGSHSESRDGVREFPWAA